MSKIIIENRRFAKLEEPDKNILYGVGRLLSYKITGVEYTPAYRDHGWDGTTYIMTRKKEFPLGLLPMVQQHYKDLGLELEIDDRRAPIVPGVEIDISSRLNELGKEPYYYQKDAVEKTVVCERGILKLPTGSGKTLLMCLVAAKLGKPCVVYVIGLDLLRQFFDTFKEILQQPIGMIGDGICTVEKFTIASIWTIGRALGIDKKDLLLDSEECEDEDFKESNRDKILKCLKEAKVNIIDEAHISSCSTIQAIYEATDSEYLYGCSGTPYREDNTDLLIKGYLGEKIVDIPSSLLIKEGYLAQPIIKFVSVPAITSSATTYQEIYKQYIVENDIRNNLVLKQTELLIDKGYQVLVLFNSLRHGRILNSLFNTSSKIKYDILDGSDSVQKRKEVKDKLLNHELNCVIASKIFDIGTDIVSISAAVMAGGGKSRIRTIQRVGRVMRKYPGKKRCIIIDFFDSAKFLRKHSKIRKETYKEEKFELILPKGF